MVNTPVVEPAEPAPTSSAAQLGAKPPTPQPGNHWRLALQADGLTLDSHLATDVASIHLIENMYNTLLRYDKRYGAVTPDLAASYNISGDQTSYTFHLHKNSRFHDKNLPVTAADVHYSIERIRRKQVRAEHFA